MTLELPPEVKAYIDAKAKPNGEGRPHTLQMIAEGGDVQNEVLNILEMAYLRNYSSRKIAGHYQRKGIRVKQVTFWRLLRDLEPYKEALIQFLQEVPRKKQFFNRETETSDYETITQYIKRAKRDGLKNYKRNIINAERCWKILNYKSPENWGAEEVLDFMATLPKAMQSNMLDAVRVIAPQLANKTSNQYIATGRFREKVGVRQKPLFGKDIRLIIEALEAKSKQDKEYKFYLAIFLLHITLGAREGSRDTKSGMVGLSWDRFKEGFSKCDLYESKVRGGIWCEDCPINLLFPELPQMLTAIHAERGKPVTEKLLRKGYKELKEIYKAINNTNREYYQGKLDPNLFKEITTLRPHDSDKIHCNLLWEARVPLEIVAGKYIGKGRGKGLMGRIWLDINTIKKHYLSLSERSDRYKEIRSIVTEYAEALQSDTLSDFFSQHKETPFSHGG